MAKQAIPEELDLLIQEYLTDGIITDKERAVLLRKAEKLGLDVDEIDLYIDAQQQKADQIIDAAAKKKRGQTCPFCGGSVPQLADKCPHCGQHISAEASEDLKEIIENLEEALVDFKSGKDFAKSKANIERHIRKANLYYSSNPKIQKLLADIKVEAELAEKKAKSEAQKRTLVKVLTYNKWLTGLAIVAICVGIWFLINSLKGPDPTEDAGACVSLIQKSLKSDDVASAEKAYQAYTKSHEEKNVRAASMSLIEFYSEKGDWPKAMGIVEGFGKYDIEDADNQDPDIKVGIMKIADAAIDRGDIQQALVMNEHIGLICDLDTKNAYKNRIAEMMVMNGHIHEAENLLNIQQWSSSFDIDEINIILKGMQKSGKSKEELKSYIDSKINSMDNLWEESKEPLRKSAYGIIGITQ